MNREWSKRDSDDDNGSAQPEWRSQPNKRSDKTEAGWFTSDLSNRPDMIAKWKRLSVATHNSVGYPISPEQREFAKKILREVEDHMGSAL